MKQMTVGDAIHLNQLHYILNSGLLHEADADMVSTEIKELGISFNLLDRFEQPMSWERHGRIIHEDEMADYRNQQVEEMIDRIGGSLEDHYNKTEEGECEHGNNRN